MRTAPSRRLKARLITAALLASVWAGVAHASEVWTGYAIEFIKQPFGDPLLPQNQDRITTDVWITRGDNKGIFNAALESAYQGSGTGGPSPVGTQWAFGTTADLPQLTFTTWALAAAGFPPGLVGLDMVVHLVDSDIYLDIRFTDWDQRVGSGGGFSYLRAAPPCQADLTGDGTLDSGDLAAFVTAFLALDPAADLTADAQVDSGDLGLFITLFLAGCWSEHQEARSTTRPGAGW